MFDGAGPLGKDDDAVAHVNGFVDVVSNKQHGRAPVLPKPQYFVLHPHAGEGVERTEWLIQQKNFGMIDQGTSHCYALCHSARKLMRISFAECFQANEAQKFFYLTAFLLKHATGSQPRRNITTHRQPGEKIGILKDKSPFSAGPEIALLVDEQLTRIGEIESGDETQQSRFSATARADDVQTNSPLRHRHSRFPERQFAGRSACRENGWKGCVKKQRS